MSPRVPVSEQPSTPTVGLWCKRGLRDKSEVDVYCLLVLLVSQVPTRPRELGLKDTGVTTIK